MSDEETSATNAADPAQEILRLSRDLNALFTTLMSAWPLTEDGVFVAPEMALPSVRKVISDIRDEEHLLEVFNRLFNSIEEQQVVLEQFLESIPVGQAEVARKIATIPPFAPDAISFINAGPALAAMRAMWAGAAGWQRQQDGPPYFQDKDGRMVYAQEGSSHNPHALEAAWQRVLSLDDSKVSTFLICLGKWMADTGGDQGLGKTRVHVADILSFRGVKKHHAGGYRREQKEEAREDILALNSIWVRSIEQVRNARGKLESRAIDSRLLEVAIESNQDLFGGFEPFAFRIAPGDWAAHFLGAHNRQVAELLRPVMRYDPAKQRLAMRLGIYLASQWRIRAGHGNYDQPWELRTLLDGALITQPTNNFERFRQQFEDALDRLQADGVIGAWQYAGDTELPPRRWFGVWLSWKVQIAPPGTVLARYAEIGTQRRKALAQSKRASAAGQQGARGRKKSA